MEFSQSRLLDDLRSFCQERATGVLDVAGDTGERIEISLQEGVIDAVSVGSAPGGSYLGARRLGHYLVEEAGVSVQDLVAVQSEARRRNLVLGEAAVSKGLVEAPAVRSLARRQAVELIRYALGKGAGGGTLRREHRAYRSSAGISYAHLVLELTRLEAGPWEGDAGWLLGLAAGADLSRYSWYPEELSILSELVQPATAADLAGKTDLDEVTVRKILGVLLAVGVIARMDAPPSHPVPVTTTNGSTPRAVFALDELVPLVARPTLDEKLEIARDGGSFTGEQFKNLKVHLGERLGTEHNVFAISSPEPGDGKSLTSLSLGFSFAADVTRRVLVLDCDLRNPAMGRYLGVDREPGLLQYFRNGKAGPHCYMRRIDNLYFMTTGGVAANPVEILSMDRMKGLLKNLRRDFDTIILDAPPYSPIADARLVTALSDGLIMVVRRGKTSFGTTDRALKAVDPNKLLGVVFNDVKPMLFHSYQVYSYYAYGDRYVRTRVEGDRKHPKNYLDS